MANNSCVCVCMVNVLTVFLSEGLQALGTMFGFETWSRYLHEEGINLIAILWSAVNPIYCATAITQQFRKLPLDI